MLFSTGRAASSALRSLPLATRLFSSEPSHHLRPGAKNSYNAFLVSLLIGAGLGSLYYCWQKAAKKRDADKLVRNPPRLIIAGPPGCGKGTQSANIVRDYGVVHISTGDMLREQVAKGTPEGLRAKKYMDAGQLVPMEVFFDLLKGRLNEEDCKWRGWLLDGYPRDMVQVELMKSNNLVPDRMVILNVSDETAVKRVCGRRTDPVTGVIYHLAFHPPPNEPAILARLTIRSDDNPDKIKPRLLAFHKNMANMRTWFPDRTHEIDAERSEEAVYVDVKRALAGLPTLKDQNK